ncbi:M23 family metallopeptidase [Chroococcidiopsis sp.]|uniref:M23 family metallopeptidase n=1 Tax=Chroococcidiopsis sp. TaxID=3088168 RepID=UPI003F29FCC8
MKKSINPLLASIYFLSFSPTTVAELDAPAMVSPVTSPGYISSDFSPRRCIYSLGRCAPHWGVDLAVPEGSAIASAHEGDVVVAGWYGSYGNTVIVCSGRYRTLYAHQSKVLVKVGDKVTQSQLIGLVGSTGLSTGPHLHFEYQIQKAGRWQAVNPAPFITFFDSTPADPKSIH